MLLIARWLSYAILLVLAARLILTAWDAVSARRSELAGPPNWETRVAIVSGGVEDKPSPSLLATMQKEVVPANGITALYVKKLDDGTAASLDADRILPTASLFKIPILVELLRQNSLGMVDMQSPVLLQQKHWADGSGVLQAQIGKSFTVQELVDYMVGVSDNTAAVALLDLIGTDNVRLTLQANGLDATRLRIGWPKRDWGGQPGENTTTAREMGMLLEKVATGKILNEKASQEAVRILSQKQQAAWLDDRLPPGTRVAHKSGELTGVRNDAGIVYGPGGPFVVVVLNSEIMDYGKAASTIAGVARSAYDFFEPARK